MDTLPTILAKNSSFLWCVFSIKTFEIKVLNIWLDTLILKVLVNKYDDEFKAKRKIVLNNKARAKNIILNLKS